MTSTTGSITLPSTVAWFHNHHFDNWNTKADDSGQKYNVGDAYPLPIGTGSDTVYLILMGDTSVITYAANGGSGTPPPSITYTMDGSFIVAAPDSLYRPGYVFAGWSDEYETWVPGNNAAPTDKNTTLTADWLPCSVSDGITSYTCQGYGREVWMTQNLNYGALGEVGQPVAEPLTVEKFCPDNNPDNCALPNGAYYLWSEAMLLDDPYQTTEYSVSDTLYQGACPTGWHLPTVSEVLRLNAFIGTTDFSDKVRDPSWDSGSNSSGFGIRSTGYWAPVLSWTTSQASYWLSPIGSTASEGMAIVFSSNQTRLNYGAGDKTFARSVRCIRNTRVW